MICQWVYNKKDNRYKYDNNDRNDQTVMHIAGLPISAEFKQWTGKLQTLICLLKTNPMLSRPERTMVEEFHLFSPKKHVRSFVCLFVRSFVCSFVCLFGVEYWLFCNLHLVRKINIKLVSLKTWNFWKCFGCGQISLRFGWGWLYLFIYLLFSSPPPFFGGEGEGWGDLKFWCILFNVHELHSMLIEIIYSF